MAQQQSLPAIGFAIALCLNLSTSVGWCDSDPLNDTAQGADPLVLAGGQATLEVAEILDGLDVDYWRITLPARSVLTVSTLPIAGNYEDPDTALFIVDGDETTVLAFNDDDQAAELPGGEQNGSTVRFRPDTAGDYFVVVTGCCNIQGGHSEAGPYALVASLVIENAGLDEDDDPLNNSFAGANDIGLMGEGAAVHLAELVSPSRGNGSGDVDYFAIELGQGDLLLATTSPMEDLPSSFDTPNTELAVVTPFGSFEIISDDTGSDQPSGSNRGSTARYQAPIAGVYYLAVSGDDDQNQGDSDAFDGSHQETGRYALTVGRIEGPPTIFEVPSIHSLGRTLLIGILALLGMVALRRAL